MYTNKQLKKVLATMIKSVFHILYNYRGVSKYHFPMYLKEVEYRFNHRKDNLFKLFISIYFGYVSP